MQPTILSLGQSKTSALEMFMYLKDITRELKWRFTDLTAVFQGLQCRQRRSCRSSHGYIALYGQRCGVRCCSTEETILIQIKETSFSSSTTQERTPGLVS